MRIYVWERIKVFLALRSQSPVRFKRWIELEETKDRIFRAARENRDDFPELICKYLSIALPASTEYFMRLPWEDTIGLFLRVSSINLPPQHLPLVSKPSASKKDKDEWDYEGRTWSLYSHLLSKSYGWNLEYIAGLSILDALSHVQEILTDEQLDREFTWNLSEASISYNSKTKISKRIELPRPYWMKRELKPIVKQKMKVDMLPAGVVSYEAIPEALRPTEIKP